MYCILPRSTCHTSKQGLPDEQGLQNSTMYESQGYGCCYNPSYADGLRLAACFNLSDRTRTIQSAATTHTESWSLLGCKLLNILTQNGPALRTRIVWDASERHKVILTEALRSSGGLIEASRQPSFKQAVSATGSNFSFAEHSILLVVR